jgi:site-specific recombinase XerC
LALGLELSFSLRYGGAEQQGGDAEALLVGVRLFFDSLMMRGAVKYNPAVRAKPPRLVRESSHTAAFEKAEIVAFLDSITPNSLKDIRDKSLFCVLL